MSDEELDKLAAEMKNIGPSKTSRRRGTDAAMAAFSAEFASEQKSTAEKTSTPTQGLAAGPRPTGQSTPTRRVQTFGRDAMTNIRKIFDVKPQTLMMGGTCMAALIASFVVFQTDQPGIGVIDPAVVEAITEAPDTTPAIETPIVVPPTVDVIPDVPPATAEPTTTITPAPVVEAPVTTPPEIKITAGTETPSNVVVIERRILKTPARIAERTVPTITKQVSRRVSKGDGTYETVTETVAVQDASIELVTIPPVYESVRETIVINADGSTSVLKSETVPVPKRVKISGGITSVDSLLAEVRSDDVVVTGARVAREAEFRSSRASEPAMSAAPESGAYASAGSESGRVTISLSSIPPSAPSSATKTTELGDAKASTHTVERTTPAVTKQVSRRVIKTPASTQERVIPAITKEVTVRVKTEDGTFKEVTKTFVIQEASTELITMPPVYETVTETVVVQEAYTELVVMNADGAIASRELKVKPPKPPKPKPLPQSGRLTAGDYDDVLNPDLYKSYLDKMLQGPLKGKDLPHVDANQRISIRVLDRLGKAVPLADISLISAGGKKMFPLRTGADGMAYLYPNFDGLKPGAKIKISVEGARSVKKKLTKKLIKNGGEIVVDLKTNRQVVESLDLLLTIDATGSMGDEMRYLQSELKSIVGRVEAANPGIDIRTGLIVYRDKGDAYVVREIPFTDDLDDFRRALGKQSASGGGDTPEAMHMAMQAGLKMNWREDALKVNLLVADAPPHSQYITDTWDAGLMSRTRGIQIVPLAASGVDKTAEFLMRSMAHITGGRFLFLTDDSGIGNPHAEPSVDCYVVTRLDGLVTRVLSSLIKGERVEPEVDDVIRSVGNYRSGICAIDSKQANVSPENATFKDEQ